MTDNMEAMGAVKDGLMYSLEVGHSMTTDFEKLPDGRFGLSIDGAGDIEWAFTHNHVPMIPEIEPFTGTYSEVVNEIARLEKIGGMLKQFIFFPHPVAKLAA